MELRHGMGPKSKAQHEKNFYGCLVWYGKSRSVVWYSKHSTINTCPHISQEYNPEHTSYPPL